MKIDSTKFALAAAITAAVFWVICSLFVWMVPAGMMNMTTNMMHTEIGMGNWTLSPMGVVWGLVAWSLFAGIFAWLLATIYNLLVKDLNHVGNARQSIKTTDNI